MTKKDICQTVTDAIIKQLEDGVAPWVKPWNGSNAFVQTSFASGKAYKGINRLILGMSATENSYRSNKWVTYNQAKKLGGQVRKGQKSTQVVLYKPVMISDPKKETGEAVSKSIPLMRTFNVFNIDQIDGIEDADKTTQAVKTRHDLTHVEVDVKATGAYVHWGHDDNEAYYSPSADFIAMPSKDQFDDAGAYYATLLHELTHWTGHKSRLDRTNGKVFGDDAYAKEELIAELGSAFLCGNYGITGKLQHASYIKSWLRTLKNDKKLIFKAAAAAQKASDLVLELAAQLPEAEAA